MKAFKLVVFAILAVSSVGFAAESKAKVSKAEGISTATVKNESSVKKFGVTWFFIGGQTLNNQTDKLSSFDIFDSYISFNYKISDDFRIAARPTFGYALQGTANNGRETNNRARIRDFSFVASFYNVAEDYLPANASYKFQPRLYLPTSDGSKDEGMIARLRFEQDLRFKLANYNELLIYAKPSYYFQRSTVYLNSAGKLRTTKAADSEHGIEYSYSLNKMFSLKPALNFVESWSNKSAANQKSTTRGSVLDYRLGLEVRATRDISFTVGLQNEQDLLAQKDDTLSYSLLTGGTFF